MFIDSPKIGRFPGLWRLKQMALTGAGSTRFLDAFQEQSKLIEASGSLRLKCTAASSLNNSAATCFQAPPNPTIHVQLAVITQASSLLSETHTS